MKEEYYIGKMLNDIPKLSDTDILLEKEIYNICNTNCASCDTCFIGKYRRKIKITYNIPCVEILKKIKYEKMKEILQ